MSETLAEYLTAKNQAEAERFKNADPDLCMLCHAYGADKRSLFVDCLYDVQEVVPEFIALRGVENEALRNRGFYLRICKTCRARLLEMMRKWAANCRELRDVPKDHDGGVDFGEEATIPVRISGATVMLTPEAYEQWKSQRGIE